VRLAGRRALLRAACGSTVTALLLAAASPVFAAEVADTEAPNLVSLTVSPAQVDASRGPVSVVVTAKLTDNASGVASAVVRLGETLAGADLKPLSGTTKSGLWSGIATIPAGTAAGGVTGYVTLRDVAGNSRGATKPSAVRALDAVPGAVGQVTAVGDVTGAINLTWTGPDSNGGSAVSSFDISATPAPGQAATEPAVTSVGGELRATTLTGLATDTRYVVKVIARNVVGAGPAAVADAFTGGAPQSTPSAPADVAATPAPQSLGLTWNAPPSDGGPPITGYDVTVGGGSPVRLPPEARSTQLPGLTNGTTYEVRVNAVNELGRGLSAETTGTPRTVPGAPKIRAATAGNASVAVSWYAPTIDGGAQPHAYLVTASLVTAPDSRRTYVLPGSARSATVGRLANGRAVTLKVAAINPAGQGTASAASVAVTPRLPGTIAVLAQPAATVVYGTASVVRADLRTAGNVSVSGRTIALYAQIRPSTTWRRVASAQTDANGLATLRVVLPATSALKLYHPVDVIRTPQVPLRTVYVATRISAAPSATRILQGKRLVVRGGIAPAHPTGSQVRLQRLTSSGWQTVAYGRMTSTSAYSVSWVPGSIGTYSLRVVKSGDSDHFTGGSSVWSQRVVAESVIDVARAIRADSSITLAKVHVSGVSDSANAYQNLVDLANGRLSRRSSYQGAPGGSTAVDIRVLRAIRRMGLAGSVTISEVTGGSHASRSGHYQGKAVDITWVNGRHVGRGSSYQMAVDACRAYGAVQVFTPSNDPYGGHQNHVHCGW